MFQGDEIVAVFVLRQMPRHRIVRHDVFLFESAEQRYSSGRNYMPSFVPRVVLDAMRILEGRPNISMVNNRSCGGGVSKRGIRIVTPNCSRRADRIVMEMGHMKHTKSVLRH